MAIVMREDGSRPVSLPATALVGRSNRAEVRLEDPLASAVHASLRWNGRAWEIRDHSSRNGTIVNGNLLPPGRSCSIRKGATIEFGTPQERWVLRDDGAPSPFAIAEDGTVVVGTESILLLPNQEDPEAIVCQVADGTWVIEETTGLTPIWGQRQLAVGSTAWTVHVPAPVESTVDAGSIGSRALIANAHLRFRVSRDEEHIEIEVTLPTRSLVLPSRAFSYLLLVLARKRIQDTPRLPPEEQGWIQRFELARMLAVEPAYVYVSILRARRQFAEAGIMDAVNLIERRAGSSAIRIGCTDLAVESC